MSETSEYKASLYGVMRETDSLLRSLNLRIAELDRHQIFYDLVGVGLTVLGLVFAFAAIVFLLSMRKIARIEAKESAEEYLTSFLSNPDNIRPMISSWMDDNRSEVATHIAFGVQALRDSAEVGDEIAGAWDYPDGQES